MALSSILYTLLVLFLALLFGILGIISSGNFTLNKLKNDIITKLDNGIIDNSTVNYVCRKATILHTEECIRTDPTYYCSGAGFTATGSKKTTTITYGQIGVNGTLASGDAFDCDVNNDGVYDPITERFYYVSDYYNAQTKEFEDDKATLIYYNNTASGVANNTSEAIVAYNSDNKNYVGPTTAIVNLPTKNQWPNINLIISTRSIIGKDGQTSNNAGNLPIDFDYSNYAARLLVTQEIENACGEIFSLGSLDNCNYLMENTLHYSQVISLNGYWLETPNTDNVNQVWAISGHGRVVAAGNAKDVVNLGVRPAITILKSNIAY